MKQITLFLLLLFSSICYSQSITLDNIYKDTYAGVKDIEGQLFYTFNPVYGSFTDHTLTLIDRELKTQKSHTFSLGKIIRIEATATFNNKFLFYISSDKTGHLYLFDNIGNQLAHKEIQTVRNGLNKAHIYASTNGFCLVQPDKEKKVGFKISMLDEQLNTKWEKRFFDDKLKFKLNISAGSEENVGVLYWNKKSLEMVSLDLKDGTQLFKKSISHEKVRQEPYHMAINKNGTIGIIGKYTELTAVKSSIETYKYFFQTIDKSGKEIGFTAEYWTSDQVNKIKSNSTLSVYNEIKSPDLFIHKLTPTTTGFSVLAESFYFYSAAKEASSADVPNIVGTPAYLYSMDIVFLNYDMQGKISSVKKVAKPVKRTATTGTINNLSNKTVSEYLNRYGRFSYRHIGKDMNGEEKIVIFNQNHNQKYVGFINPNEEYENILTRNYVELLSKPNGSGELSNEVFKYSGLTVEEIKQNGELDHTNVLPSDDGFYILTTYKDKTVTLTKKKMEPSTDPKLIKGVFRHIENGAFLKEGYYTLYFSESSINGNLLYGLQCMGKDEQLVSSTALEIPQNFNFTFSQLYNNKLLLFFRNNKIGEDIIIYIDENGKKEKEVKIRTILTSGFAHTGVKFLFGKEGFVRTSNIYSNTSQGIDITYFDKNAKRLWSKDLTYNKNPLMHYNLVSLTNTEINIYKTIGGSDLATRKKELISLDLEGNVKQEESLYLNDATTLYSHTLLGNYESGTSNYMAGIKYSRNKSKYTTEGIFFHNTDNKIPENTTVLNWDKVAEIMKVTNLTEDIKKGVIRLKFDAITRHKEGIALITEVIKYQQESSIFGSYTTGNGILTNFIVFIFNEDGSYKQSFSISKSPLNTTGLSSSKPISYQYCTKNIDGKNLVYTNIGSDLELYLFKTEFKQMDTRDQMVVSPCLKENEKQEVEVAAKTQLDKLQAKIEKLNDDWDKLFNTETPSYKEDRDTYYIPSGESSIFVYRHDYKMATVKWEKRNFK